MCFKKNKILHEDKMISKKSAIGGDVKCSDDDHDDNSKRQSIDK